MSTGNTPDWGGNTIAERADEAIATVAPRPAPTDPIPPNPIGEPRR